MSTLTNRQTWTDEDFRVVFAFIRDVKEVLKTPECAAEYAPVLLGDAERAAAAMVYIMRGTGANV